MSLDYFHQGVSFREIFQHNEGSPYKRIPFGDTGFTTRGYLDLADDFIGINDGGNTNYGGGVTLPVKYSPGYMTYLSDLFSGPITENPDVNIFYDNKPLEDHNKRYEGTAKCEIEFTTNGSIYYWKNGRSSATETPDNLATGHKWVNNDKRLFPNRFRIQVTSVTGQVSGAYSLASSIAYAPNWSDLLDDRFIIMEAYEPSSYGPIAINGGYRDVDVKIEEVGNPSNSGTLRVPFYVTASNQTFR